MNKIELIEKISDETGFTEQKVNMILSEILKSIKDQLILRKSFTFQNFGGFELSKNESSITEGENVFLDVIFNPDSKITKIL